MRELFCKIAPREHGGRVVFDEEKVHYCVECNTVMVPKEEL